MIPIPRAWFRTFARNVYLFLAVQLLIGFAFDGGIYSVLFNLYLLRLGYGPEFVGLVNALGLLAFALLSLPAGIAGQRYGIKRMMLVGLVVMIGGGTLLPLAELIASPWQEGGLMLGYVAVMAGLAFFFVNGTPFMMGSTSTRERNRVFSLQMALLSVAAFAGSLFGGRLPALFAGLLGLSTDHAAPYRYPLFLAGFLLIPAIPLILRAQDVDPRLAEKASTSGDEATGVAAIRVAPFLLIAMLVFVRFFQVSGVATTSTFFNVYLDAGLNVSTTQIGLLTAIGRLMAVPAALLVPLLGRRWGNLNLVIWAGVGTALSFLPLALIPHWAAAGAGFIGVTVLSALRYPAFMVYSMELVAPQQRGAVAGAGEMAAGFCFSLIALAGGYLITAAGFSALFLITSALSAIGSLVFWIYFRSPHPSHPERRADGCI